jgi:predicted Holliday junction resolvase-like endonuclease
VQDYLYTVKYILLALLIYIAYQFLFKLVVPIYKTTKQVKQKFREMQAQMEEHQKQQQGFSPGYTAPETKQKEKTGDYIDFEEVK